MNDNETCFFTNLKTKIMTKLEIIKEIEKRIKIAQEDELQSIKEDNLKREMMYYGHHTGLDSALFLINMLEEKK